MKMRALIITVVAVENAHCHHYKNVLFIKPTHATYNHNWILLPASDLCRLVHLWQCAISFNYVFENTVLYWLYIVDYGTTLKGAGLVLLVTCR